MDFHETFTKRYWGQWSLQRRAAAWRKSCRRLANVDDLSVLSVCLSVTQVDQLKTVEVRIMQLLPYSSPIPLVFAG